MEDQILSLQAIIRSTQNGDSAALYTRAVNLNDSPEYRDSVPSPKDCLDETEALPTAPFLSGDERSNEALQDLGNMVWKMNIGEGGEPALTGPSGNFCFPGVEVVQSPTAAQQVSVPATENRPDVSFHACANDNILKYHLANCFLDLLNPYHQFTQSQSLDMFDEYPNEPDDLAFLHSSILAAGSCVSRRPGSRAAGNTFADYAENLALKACRSHPSLAVVQGLTILAWRELSEGRDNTGWIYNCKSL